MNVKINEVALGLGILSSLFFGVSGCLDLDSPACAGLPADGVLYVHGSTGNDESGTGQCSTPYKTITKALAAAKTSNATVVHVRGDSTPLVYGTATTGEKFPLLVDKNGLTLEGDGEESVILRGGGTCAPIDETENCALAVIGADITIRGLQIENITGHGIRSESSSIKLENLTTTNCETAGLLLISADARLTRVTSTNNGFDGLRANLPPDMKYKLTIDECTFTNNGHRGLFCQNTGEVGSKNTIYANNAWSGAAFEDFVAAESTGDTYENNSYGLAAMNGATGVKIELINALVQQNRAAGVHIAEGTSFKMRGSRVVDNASAGVSVAIGGENVDLGSALDPGGNTLQSASNPNAVGLCFTGTGSLIARGNHFARCPPTSNSDLTCTGGVDVGGSTMLDVGDCFAP